MIVTESIICLLSPTYFFGKEKQYLHSKFFFFVDRLIIYLTFAFNTHKQKKKDHIVAFSYIIFQKKKQVRQKNTIRRNIYRADKEMKKSISTKNKR
jgi:uncharacterized membrane protein